MDIYSINTSYIDYLKQFDKTGNILDNEKENGEIRPYVGIIYSINEFNYFVPLSSPKDSDYLTDKNDGLFILDENGNKIIRRSVVPIYRIIIKSTNPETGENEINFLGKLRFNSMIPVPESEITKLDIDNWPNEKHKNIFQNQIRHLRKNKPKLLNGHAKVIYTQKTHNRTDINYIKNTVDFKLLESKMTDYININSNISPKEVEINPVLKNNDLGQP